MNLLFIIISVFAVYERTTYAFDIKHNLLIPPDDAEIVDESFTNGLSSYKFNSAMRVQVDHSATDLVGLNFAAPFIVTAIFKSTNGTPLCLFSITQGDRSVLNLCIQQSGITSSTITLRTELYEPDDTISNVFNVDYTNQWIKIVVFVRDDKADIYVNCSKKSDTLDLVKSKDYVPLTNDMKIELAYSLIDDQFEGLIEEISIYTNADDETLKYICTMITELKPREEQSEPSGKPDARGNIGPKGDKGSQGPKDGIPGISGNHGRPGMKGDKLQTDFEYGGDEISKNPELRRSQRLEYNFIKDLAECRREITVLKDGIKEQIENITMSFQNEIKEDIEALKSTNEYLLQELLLIRNIMLSKTKKSQGINLNRNYLEKQDKL